MYVQPFTNPHQQSNKAMQESKIYPTYARQCFVFLSTRQSKLLLSSWIPSKIGQIGFKPGALFLENHSSGHTSEEAAAIAAATNTSSHSVPGHEDKGHLEKGTQDKDKDKTDRTNIRPDHQDMNRLKSHHWIHILTVATGKTHSRWPKAAWSIRGETTGAGQRQTGSKPVSPSREVTHWCRNKLEKRAKGRTAFILRWSPMRSGCGNQVEVWLADEEAGTSPPSPPPPAPPAPPPLKSWAHEGKYFNA